MWRHGFFTLRDVHLQRVYLEDKHVVNEHHVIRKSHDATQKKCPHVVHFNVPRDWFEINSRH